MLAVAALYAASTAQTVVDAQDVGRWMDLIQAAQVYYLKRVGCYRLNLDPAIVTHELTKGDCGKPSEIDWKASDRARKLAMKIWGLKDK